MVPFPLYWESRSNIPNSATAAANFRSGAAFSNFESLSTNDFSVSSLTSPSGLLWRNFTVTISGDPLVASVLFVPYFNGSTGGTLADPLKGSQEDTSERR